MVPLYSYNGALLRVDGALASSQECCCTGPISGSGTGYGPASLPMRSWVATPDPRIIRPEDAGTPQPPKT